MRTTLTVLALLSLGCAATESRDAVEPYPLDTCVVMDSKLGTMGDPIVRVYDGREIKFCCAPCVEEFEKDPEFYFEQLDAQLEAR